MRSSHPVLGNRNLLIVILDYLDGEDLFQIIQVCFSFRTTVQSMPNLEISLMKFTMKQSNECIERLKSSGTQGQSFLKYPQKAFNTIPFVVLKKRTENKRKIVDSTKVPGEPDLASEKWTKFVDYFQKFAEIKGFSLRKRKDFEDEKEWEVYQKKFNMFYYSYVDHIKTVRANANRPIQRNPFFNAYSSLMDKLNFSLRSHTYFTHFPRDLSERKKPDQGGKLVLNEYI